MWSEDEFSHESDRLQIPPRPIHPKPRQDPHPAMYLACTREATLNEAGEWGLGALCLGFGGPEDVAQKNRVYRAAVERRTRELQIPDFPTIHLAALCPAIVREGEELVAYLHEEKIEVGTEATGLFNPNHAYGTVSDAVGYCERLAEAGADEIMFLVQMGGVPQEAALRTIRNLGEEVIPRFR